MRLGEGMNLESALVVEHDLYLLLQTTGDRHEGLTAFREGREPRFTGT
jgi:enoyl-CoA hydratase/3-hydroxyacyl-CoA dehydrogenase